MLHFAGMTDQERLARLERKVTEIRKMLFGALLLAKDSWKDELSQRGEGLEIMDAMEKAEESFTQVSQPDGFKRLEHTLDIINQRARSIFSFMSYMSKYGKSH